MTGVASRGKPVRSQRLIFWAAGLGLPVAMIVGGIIGAWFGNVGIGVALGAAIGFSAVIMLLAVLVITAAKST